MTWLEKLTTNPAITEALPEAVVETLLMVAISGVATVLIGGLLGILHGLLRLRPHTGKIVLRALHLSERVVTLSRSYPTDAADLWDACTNAERLPRWFAPVHGELRLNGTYQVEGNASGTIRNSFSASWNSSHSLANVKRRNCR